VVSEKFPAMKKDTSCMSGHCPYRYRPDIAAIENRPWHFKPVGESTFLDCLLKPFSSAHHLPG
jgi:hypothetical protein